MRECMSDYSIGATGRAEKKVMFQKHLLGQNFSGEELAFKEPAQERDGGDGEVLIQRSS